MELQERFVIRCEKGFIALDDASGGYPWYTDSMGAMEFFTSREAARKYMAICHREAQRDGWELCRAELQCRPFFDKNASTEPMNRRDVHTEHCCVYHGCKYGDDDCPVVTKNKRQSLPCEECVIR